MRVKTATAQDWESWLELAAEVEPLFGPLCQDPTFHRALRSSVELERAYCVRERDGPPGTKLVGGLLFSPARPDRQEHRIGWLAVREGWRRCGIGRALIDHVLGLPLSPVPIAVVTFGDEREAGQVAASFYERLGFRAAEPALSGPDGGSRRIFRRDIC